MQEQIVIKSDNSIILTAPVMIPGAKDCDYWRGEEPFTIDQVKAFKEAYDDYGFIDKNHAVRDLRTADKNELIGDALKSFLLESETSYTWFDGSVHTYPRGTWMLTSLITDPVAIKQAKEGAITGYSPSVFKRETAEKLRAVLKEDSGLKASAGGLIKNINDPVPALVSLVRQPCQHGSKFCKKHKRGEDMSEDNAKSKIEQIKNILGFEEKVEYATKEDFDEFKESVKISLKSEEMTNSLKVMINEAVAEAIKPLALKEDSNSDDKPDEKKESNEKSNNKKENEEHSTNEKDKKTDEEDENGKSEDKKGLKSDSKSLPLHDDGQNKPAIKSDSAIVLGIMGRSTNGRPLKRQ